MAVSFDSPLVRLANLFPGREIYAKCELLAPSGSFKIHGIFHLLKHLRQGSTRLLVVPSMGNTVLGVATGVRGLDFHTLGVVPQSISRAKDEKLQALGVELIKVAGGGNDVLRRAAELAQERNGYLVHPHLDPHWTDGYQVLVEQILQAIPQCRSIVFPVGGGGLLMGLSEYLVKHSHPLRLHGCEAYNAPTYASFNHPRTSTIADGLILETPHPRVQERIAAAAIAIHMVRDDDIRAALDGLYHRYGLVVEPSAAVTVAAARALGPALEEPACLILTGGNITREDFDRLIEGVEW